MKFHLPSLRKSSFFVRAQEAPSGCCPVPGSSVKAALMAGAICLSAGIWQARGAATPAPSPTVVASPSPTATPEGTPETRNYDGTQQASYIKTANNAYLEAREGKSTPFVQANNAYLEAGGASGKGLTSKDAVKERREMIQKAIQANDDYLAFVNGQVTFYHDELAKTPLIKADVEGLTSNFAETSKTEEVKKLRETTGDMLKTGDKMMELLETKYGTWKLNGNKPSFKKQSEASAYSALAKKYNSDVEAIQKMAALVNAPLPTPGASPIPNASPSPSGAAQPQATASAATTASPTPSAKAKP